MQEVVGDYRLGRILGSGGFSHVRLAHRVDDTASAASAVAVKVLERSARNPDDKIKDEIRSFRRLSHKNVVGFIGHIVTRRNVYIILEYVGGGELYDQLEAATRFDEAKARELFLQVLDGVEYCHSRGVCHRDLKLENLLVSTVDGSVKITDFGFAKNFANAEPSSCVGTALYVAPEVVMNGGAVEYSGEAADVWSLGIILYLLTCGRFPFNRNNKNGIGPGMTSAQRSAYSNTNFKRPSYLSPQLVDLLAAILTADPVARLTTAQIRAHGWLAVGAAGPSSPVTPARASRLDASFEATPPSEPTVDVATSTEAARPAADGDSTLYPPNPFSLPGAAAAAAAAAVEWNVLETAGERRSDNGHGFDTSDEDEEWDEWNDSLERTFERRLVL